MKVIRPIAASSTLAVAKLRLSGQTFRDLASTAGVNVGSVLLTSIGGVLLARNLGATDRGGLVTVLLWPAAAGVLASFGLTQATCYWIARRRAEGAAIMKAAVRAALLTGLVVAVAGVAVAPLIGRNDTVISLLRVVFVMSPLFIASGVWASALQAADIAAWNRVRAAQPISYFSLVLGLALVQRLTLTTATAAFCCSLVLQAVFARIGATGVVDGSEAARPHVLRTLYGYGLRVWAAAIPQLINIRLDMLVLSVMSAIAASELGVYAVAVSLSWLALPAATAFGSVAFPKVAGSTSESATRRIERISLCGAAAAAAFVLAPVCLIAPFAVPLLFGAEFEGAVACLWLLAPGTVCLAVNRVLADLLQGRGRPLSTSFGEGAGAILTVALLLLLTPHFGIRGAAAASSTAYLGATLVLYVCLETARRATADNRGLAPS